jgi:hypothetical protein
MAAGDAATEDEREGAGLTDLTIGIQQAVAQSVQGGAALEDDVITIFQLGNEEAMLHAGFAPLVGGEERRKPGEPVVLVEAEAGREGELGTDAHKHASPVPVVQVKVVLIDLTRFVLQVPLLESPAYRR